MQPRFHGDKFKAFLKPLIIDLGASYKSATKYFCIIYSPTKISRLVACLLHKIPAGLHLMTYVPSLFIDFTRSNKQLQLFTIERTKKSSEGQQAYYNRTKVI